MTSVSEKLFTKAYLGHHIDDLYDEPAVSAASAADNWVSGATTNIQSMAQVLVVLLVALALLQAVRPENWAEETDSE